MMLTIGQLCVTDDGYEGTISTLTLASNAVVKRVERKSYLKVSCDDSSFSNLVWAAMSGADGRAELTCSRPKLSETKTV